MIWGWDERIGEKVCDLGMGRTDGGKVYGLWLGRTESPADIMHGTQNISRVNVARRAVVVFLLGLRDCKTTSSIVGTLELARHKNDCCCCCCCCCCFCVCLYVCLLLMVVGVTFPPSSSSSSSSSSVLSPSTFFWVALL